MSRALCIAAGALLSAACIAGCSGGAVPGGGRNHAPAPAIRVEGMGTEDAISVQRKDVLKEIGLPVYSGAELVEGSQMAAHDADRSGISYSARFRSPDAFDDIMRWYERKLNVQAMSGKVAGTRGALLTPPKDGKGASTVTLTQKRDQKTVSITLARFVKGR